MSLKDKEVQISVVIPIWDEENKNIEELYARLTKTLSLSEKSYEIVFVDDGSSDRVFAVLTSLHHKDKRVKLVKLKKNFKQAAAFLAGLDYAHGKTIITMDADLQYAPEEVPRLIKKINEGFDAVSGKRINRCDPSFARRLPSYVISSFISRKVGIKLDYGCSFNALKKGAVEELKDYGQRRRFVKPLVVKLAKSVAEVDVEHWPRKRGKSKYNLFRLALLGLDILINFSTRPSQDRKPLYIIDRIIE